MKRIILLLAVMALAGSATAQNYNISTQNQRNWEGTKVYVSPSYGIFLAKEVFAPRVNLTVAYDIIPQLRLGLTGGLVFNDAKNFFTVALMIGSTELYTTPYSRTYSEISFGVGFIPIPNYPASVYFPIRYRWGIGFTKNLAIGLEGMVGMTTVKNALFVCDLGIFCALKF